MVTLLISLITLFAWRGKPFVISRDNGTEYVSAPIQDWTKSLGIQSEFMQLCQPQQNAYIERFNGTVRYDWLSQYFWETLNEVQRYAKQCLWI